jgi:hypothetical protein
MRPNEQAHNTIEHAALSMRPSIRKADPRDLRKNFDPKGWVSHAKTASVLGQVGLNELAKGRSECAQCGEHAGCVLRRCFDPQVEILRGAGAGVEAHGVSAAEQVLRVSVVQRGKQIEEVAREGMLPSTGKARSAPCSQPVEHRRNAVEQLVAGFDVAKLDVPPGHRHAQRRARLGGGACRRGEARDAMAALAGIALRDVERR